MIRATFRPASPSGVDGRLALGVGEVGRHGDDGVVDRFVPELLASASSLSRQDEGRQVRRVVIPAVELELVERAAHVGLEEAGDLVVAQPGPLLGLVADGRRGPMPK